MSLKFPDQKFIYHSEQILYNNLCVKNTQQAKEYFLNVMGDQITDNDINVEELKKEQIYAVYVGKIECYIVEFDRIYKCNSFNTLKSKYLQNCIASLSNLIDLHK